MDKGSLRMMQVFLFAAIALLGGTYFPLISMIEPLKITLLISFFLFYGVMGNLMHRLFGRVCLLMDSKFITHLRRHILIKRPPESHIDKLQTATYAHYRELATQGGIKQLRFIHIPLE